MIPEFTVEKTKFGYEHRFPRHLILFGGKEANFAHINNHYKDFEFVRVKQTHGDQVVDSPNTSLDYQVEADAHLSETQNLGLCISTADCVPCFIFDNQGSLIAGIHAGWRGVVQRIIPKTITEMLRRGVNSQDLNVLIGPHIQKQSFQVGNDVREQLLASIATENEFHRLSFYTEQSADKSLVDLHQVVHFQLHESGILQNQVHDLEIDTVTDLDFHSHRRDREKAGRQLSFILRHG